MRNAKEAKSLIESLMPLQEKGVKFPCPRCGRDRMDPKPVRNALSRYAKVYICDTCGLEEAMMDFCGQEPMPLTAWSMAISF